MVLESRLSLTLSGEPVIYITAASHLFAAGFLKEQLRTDRKTGVRTRETRASGQRKVLSMSAATVKSDLTLFSKQTKKPPEEGAGPQ